MICSDCNNNYPIAGAVATETMAAGEGDEDIPTEGDDLVEENIEPAIDSVIEGGSDR